MTQTINESIKSKEFNGCDGLVLYIYPHGYENSFLTSNCQLIWSKLKIFYIWMIKVNGKKDDSFYKNMPKTIIFDCCGG